MSNAAKPLIGIPASVRQIEWDLSFHGNGVQYYEAVTQHVGGNVLTIPSLDDTQNAIDCLDHLDGVLLTGSFSNLHPSTYEETRIVDGQLFDPLRDVNSILVIRETIERGIPLFGICRGLQEINVAFGGSLYQELHRVPGRFDHRSGENKPLKEHFVPAHEIDIQAGGVLETLGHGPKVTVNSSHEQGVDRLGENLQIEAISEDGTIEALSVAYSPGWNLSVQFHPEWFVQETPFYQSLFSAFGDAARSYRRRR